MNNDMTFAAWLSRHVDDPNRPHITRTWLADNVCNGRNSTISGWLHQNAVPDALTSISLRNVLGLTEAEFVGMIEAIALTIQLRSEAA